MYKLPDLPYKYEDLEPHIDTKTMQIHHDKHHGAYVDNLNKALADHKELLEKPIEKLLLEIDKIPEEIRQNVINNGGGHANHSLFWTIMAPNSSDKPTGDLMEAFNKYFGGFDKFKNLFSEKAMSIFGSGWAFLILESDSSLTIKRQSFQNSPHMHGSTPILGLDVWEHAYYLKYQNRKVDYVSAFWNVVNWKRVEDNFGKAI